MWVIHLYYYIGLADDSQQEPARKVEEIQVIQHNQSAQIVEAPEMHLEVQIENSEMVLVKKFFFKNLLIIIIFV